MLIWLLRISKFNHENRDYIRIAQSKEKERERKKERKKEKIYWEAGIRVWYFNF